MMKVQMKMLDLFVFKTGLIIFNQIGDLIMVKRYSNN